MIQRETLYDVLGVTSDASTEEVSRAFHRLTREHHPDLFQGERRAAAEMHFQLITEAFNVLSRSDSRERYDRELAQSRPGSANGLSSREISRRLMNRAAAHFKERRLAEAEQDLAGAIDHDPENARALHLMGLVLARTDRARSAMRVFEQAAVLDPADAASRAEAAAVALTQGLNLRAQRLAEDALGVDPENTRALRVLAELAAMEATGSSDGLLDRLRRKG